VAATDITVTGRRQHRDPNEFTLSVDGKIFGGWQDVQIAAGVERMPREFAVLLTERYPGQIGEMVIQPGQKCIARIGDDDVVSGYIDRYMPSISPAGHAVRITGRGKCQDLVDCSADNPSAQIGGKTTLDLITDIAARAGIDVTTIGSPSGLQKPTPQFNINLGETPFEIIDRVGRSAALLSYEDRFGQLVLAQAGQTKAASGFRQGINIQSASATFAMDGRFSDYVVVWQSVQTMLDPSSPGANGNARALVQDAGVPRKRVRIIVCDQYLPGPDFGLLRGQWEASRRFGRSNAVTIVADSWRDSAGALWEPNTLAVVDIPALKIVAREWVIGEVIFLRSGSEGTTAQITLMPVEAYQPEPSSLLSADWQVAQEVGNGGAAAK
jgi:prophage tail gpP-like protein